MHAVESEVFVQEPLNGGKDHRKIFRHTSGHHRIHSELVDRNGVHRRGQQPESGIRRVDGLRQHGANVDLGWRDDGKAVRPAPLIKELKNSLHSSVDDQQIFFAVILRSLFFFLLASDGQGVGDLRQGLLDLFDHCL